MNRRYWFLLVLATSSCESHGRLAPPEVGVIDHYGERSEITHPAEVQRGLNVEVTVRTFGNGCVSTAGTGVRYHENTAVIVPYDNDQSRLGEGFNCPDILNRPLHTVMLRFPSEGEARIRVEGRNAPGGRWTVIESIMTVTPLR